ncbi:hypothetical protein [Frankia sp. AgB32]|uniref:hypothetical protein n=1 Tax=Frankia sp. AgB32 TaxID=631119 RepID=UPI00200CC996|nr:hypothetical protein [Frankia sp. AgB32]MCK9897050.1 hypothetical protein [Frankia sp. AgB32]
MNRDFAGSVLAAQERGAGGLGLLVVVGMLVASAAVFFFMSKSLRRMRENVASGAFRGVESDRTDPVDPRQSLRRRSTFLGGGSSVIDGEVVGGKAVPGKALDGMVIEGGPAQTDATSREDGGGQADGGRPDLPVQPGPPAGR